MARKVSSTTRTGGRSSSAQHEQTEGKMKGDDGELHSTTKRMTYEGAGVGIGNGSRRDVGGVRPGQRISRLKKSPVSISQQVSSASANAFKSPDVETSPRFFVFQSFQWKQFRLVEQFQNVCL